MFLKSIFFKNIRSLSEFSGNINKKQCIIGVNGSGKTSVLEAVSLSFTGKSFRTSEKRGIIKDETDYFFIKSEVEDKNGYDTELSIGMDLKGSRKIALDGETVSRKNLMDTVSCVVHTPDDVEIIRGTPSKRRNFIDRAIFTEYDNCYDLYMNYRRFLKHKSIVLRRRDRKTLLRINSAAVEYIKRIRSLRKEIIEKLNSVILNLIEYTDFKACPVFKAPDDDSVEEKLENAVEREMERGYPVYGPHVDKIRITINGRSRDSISLGELKFLSFLLRTSELKMYGNKNQYPVFLCDDIFSFLDEKRCTYVVDIMENIKNQVICTSVSDFKNNSDKFRFISM